MSLTQNSRLTVLGQAKKHAGGSMQSRAQHTRYLEEWSISHRGLQVKPSLPLILHVRTTKVTAQVRQTTHSHTPILPAVILPPGIPPLTLELLDIGHIPCTLAQAYTLPYKPTEREGGTKRERERGRALGERELLLENGTAYSTFEPRPGL